MRIKLIQTDADYQNFVKELPTLKYPFVVKIEDKGKRSDTQNNAMHLYFEHLAQALNDSGLDMRKTLKPEIDIPWTKDLVKEYLWRPIQKAMTGKDSTTEISKLEPSDIHATLDRHLSEKFGLHVEWPTRGML